jgi:hypothetical protein
VISAGTGIEPPFTTLPKAQILRYGLVITGGVLAAYVSTRSSILIGDGRAFVEIAQAGDPAHLHFGEPSHFLQLPLTRAIWLALTWLGMPVSLDRVLISMSLAGTLATAVFIGLIASELLDSQAARWLAALLFAASLNAWTQWNGELYGLGLGFVTAGLFFTLRGHVVVPAALWALSVLCRAEFGLAAPAFAVAVSVGWPACGSTRERTARIAALLALAAVLTLAELLAGSWMLGKWSNGTSLVEWLQRSVDARERDIAASPEVFRAMKGLVTAFSVAGHYARDLATARAAITDRAFLGAAGAGLLVLGATAGFVAIALGERRLVPFALAWLLPFHVCINWWFLPTVEKYHAAALPPFVLLVTAGLVRVGRRVGRPSRYAIYTGYAAICAALNLFGAVLPMRALGAATTDAAHELRQLNEAAGSRAVFVACDASRPLVETRAPFLRVRSIWTGTVPEIQHAITAWTTDRLARGEQPYVVGRWCFPDEWRTRFSKAPFDLFFLEQSFMLVPTRISGVPLAEPAPTDPFTWRQGAVVRLDSKQPVDRHGRP